MKRIFEWIVNKRYIVLGFMIVLVVICGFLMLKVEQTSDMTKFLSDDSSMKQGIELIKEEFPDMENQNTVRVMFKGLTEEEAEEVFTGLEKVDYVDSVSYDSSSSDYVKEPYRLFILSFIYDYESEEEDVIISAIEEKYEGYDIEIKDDNTNSSEIPGPAILTAVAILVLIMILMCASWIEPLFFMIAIGFAVVINLGTNIFMDYVANITYAVAAILQLVLSMDYSIILSNRFRQERELEENKYKAMSDAMTNAFSSICSSSLTTFAGLLCLVFMTFKIGENIGFVLAKGVVCSLVCVMTVLPVLLLIFDGAIRRVKKKPVDIGTKALASFSFKFKKPIFACFILLFAAAFYLHNFTDITYTLSYEDKIAEVFPKTNTIVCIYDNDDEKEVSKIADTLSENEHVKEVQSYYTALGKKYTAEKMAEKIEEFSDEKTLKMIYYTYHDGTCKPMTLSAFADLLNDEYDEYIEGDIKKYTDKSMLLKNMSAEGLSSFFGMEKEDALDILIYYSILNEQTSSEKMTIASFAEFAEEISEDERYESMINSQDIGEISKLKVFSDKKEVTKKRSVSSFSKLTGINEEKASLIYISGYAEDESYKTPSITLEDFVKFLNKEVISNESFSSDMDSSAKENIKNLKNITNTKLIKTTMSAKELAAFFSMEKKTVNNLLSMQGVKEMSPYDFAGLLLQIQPENEDIKTMKNLMDQALSKKKLKTSQMKNILGMEEKNLRILYTYYDYIYGNTSFKMSIEEAVDEALTLSSSSELKMIKKIISSAVSEKEYSAKELAKLLGMDEKDISSLYIFYEAKHGDSSEFKLTPAGFIGFLNDEIIGSEYASFIDESQKESLEMADEMINAVISDKKFTPSELYDMFCTYSEDLTEENIELLYLLYGSEKNYKAYWKMSIDELFTFIKDDICKDERFKNVISQSARDKIDEYAKELDEGRKQLKGSSYSLMQIVTDYPQEGEALESFMDSLSESFNKLSGEYHFIGSSAMTYEMSKGFNHEILMITLLTALAIFIVVMFTFKSIIIPAVLVLLVQCGVYMTVSYIGISGNSIYYLAMLIVQCILMGATIDYAILFTSYYRENRLVCGVKEAIGNAYKGSIHTILTSGLIIVLCTFILSYTYGDPSVEQICRTISIGAFCAIFLILFVLPGILSCMDKLVTKRKE